MSHEQPEQQAISGSAGIADSMPGRAGRAIDVWPGLLMPLVYGMLGAMLAILMTHLLHPGQPHVAAVDVLKIMDTYDAETIEAIKNGDVDAAKRAADSRAKRAAEIEVLLDQLARERGLLLVQKQAILGGEVSDLTGEILLMLEQKR